MDAIFYRGQPAIRSSKHLSNARTLRSARPLSAGSPQVPIHRRTQQRPIRWALYQPGKCLLSLAGEHGHAVLNYQQALRLDPTQADALHNIHYLRSITVDELPVSRSQRVADALLFWHRWPASRADRPGRSI